MQHLTNESQPKRQLPKLALWITCFVLGAELLTLSVHAAAPANTSKQSVPKQYRAPSPAMTQAPAASRPGLSMEQQVLKLTQQLRQLKQRVQTLEAANNSGGQQQNIDQRLSTLEGAISVSSGKVTISLPGSIASIELDGSTVRLNAGIIKLDAGMTLVPNVLKSGTIIANSITAKAYTPGSGNIW